MVIQYIPKHQQNWAKEATKKKQICRRTYIKKYCFDFYTNTAREAKP